MKERLTGLTPPGPPEKPRHGLLPFSREDTLTLKAETQRLFRPRGLMLWDVGLTTIRVMLIGTNLEQVCALNSVPARWFTMADSFAQVAKLVDEGKEPPGWGDWSIIYPGVIARLHFDTAPPPEAQALFWGEYW